MAIDLRIYVATPTGTPIAGATVTYKAATLAEPNGNPVLGTTSTNASGMAEFTAVADGAYDVYAASGGQQLNWKHYTAVPQSFGNGQIATSAGIVLTKLDDGDPLDDDRDPTTYTPTTLHGQLERIISQIKDMVGGTDWYSAPASTLATIWGKFHQTTGHKHTGVAGDAPLIDATTGTADGTISPVKLAYPPQTNLIPNPHFKYWSKGVSPVTVNGGSGGVNIGPDAWDINGTSGSSLLLTRATAASADTHVTFTATIAPSGQMVARVYLERSVWLALRQQAVTLGVVYATNGTTAVRVDDGVLVSNGSFTADGATRLLTLSHTVSGSAAQLLIEVQFNASAAGALYGVYLFQGNRAFTAADLLLAVPEWEDWAGCARRIQARQIGSRFISATGGGLQLPVQYGPMGGTPTVTVVAGTRINVSSGTVSGTPTRGTLWYEVAPTGAGDTTCKDTAYIEWQNVV